MVLQEIIETLPETKGQESESRTIPVKESRLLWEEMNCEILKVTLRSGEEFAIDLAAAQYGHFDRPVIDWHE